MRRPRIILTVMALGLLLTSIECAAASWQSLWAEDFSGAAYSLEIRDDYFNDFYLLEPNDVLVTKFRRHSGNAYNERHNLENTLGASENFRLSFDVRMEERTLADYANAFCGRIGVWDAGAAEVGDASGIFFILQYNPLYTGNAYWQAKGLVKDSVGNEYATSARTNMHVQNNPDDADELKVTYHVILTYESRVLTCIIDGDNFTSTESISLPAGADFIASSVGVSGYQGTYPTGTPLIGWIDNMRLEQKTAVCGDAGHPYPYGDLNEDCYVGLADLAIIAGAWLDCRDPQPPCNFEP